MIRVAKRPDPEELLTVCKRNRISGLALFGSVARGGDRADSDLDLLADFDPSAVIGLMDLARANRELSDVFGRKVDLVPRTGLKPIVRSRILADLETLVANGSIVPGRHFGSV